MRQEKVNKKFIIPVLFLFLICVFYVNGYTLIDSENFNNYSVYQYGVNIGSMRDLLINESFGEWNCTSVAIYNRNCVGAGHTTSANYSINDWGTGDGNHYLSMWNLGGTSALGYTYTSLWWNSNNLDTTCTNCTYTFNWKLRFRNYPTSPIHAVTQIYATGLMRGGLAGGIGFGFGEGLVNYNGTTEGMNHLNQLRPAFNGALFTPYTDTGCYINDGLWHDIVSKQTYNPVFLTIDKLIYVDGIMCSNDSTPSALPIGINNGMIFEVASQYLMDVDDIKIYSGDAPVQSVESYDVAQTLNYCPISGCLFYDDFNQYSSNYTINFSVPHNTAPNDNGWDYFNGLVINQNSILYLNSSIWGVDGQNADLSHNLSAYSYNRISSVMKFQLNGTTPTPQSMINELVNYRLSTFCENGLRSSLTSIYFVRNDEWSFSENRSVFNTYVSNVGVLRLLGTVTIDNDDFFYIKQDYDFINGYVYYSLLQSQDVSLPAGYYQFSNPIIANCKIQRFTITRGDIENPEDLFIGIDLIYFYGIADFGQTNTTFLYANATSYNNSIVKTDIGEEILNAIPSFGIRTPLSKFLLFAALMIIGTIGIIKASLPDSAKIIIFYLMSFIITIGSYYLQLLPLSLFVGIIFIFAIAAAYQIWQIFAGKQST